MVVTRRMSLQDAAMLTMETPVTPMHMGGGGLFRLPKGAGNDFVQRLHDRWRRYPVDRPPFNFRVADGPLSAMRMHWEVADEVNLGQHFFRVALPHPGDDGELERLIAQLHARILERGRPLWEVYLIEGLSDQRFAMYTKVHHALVDGASAVRIFGDQFTEDPRKLSTPPVWTLRGRRQKRPSKAREHSAGLLEGLPLKPGAFVATLGRAYENVAQAATALPELTRMAREVRAPDTIFNRPISARREVGQVVFEFSRVKTLSKGLDCTINDVALTVCGGALRRYLAGIDALPRESLVCTVPISLKKEGGAEGGNFVTAMPIPLATDVDDVRERFERIRDSMRDAKARVAKISPEAVALYTGVMQMPVVIEQVTGRWPLRHRAFNLILSNVPGPRTRLYLCGSEFLGSIPVPMILRGMGLNITITSLLDRIWFSYTTCPDVAPHIKRLGPLITRSFEELERVMIRPQRSAKSRRTSRTNRQRRQAR